jgi:hypothetical protein
MPPGRKVSEGKEIKRNKERTKERELWPLHYSCKGSSCIHFDLTWL